MHALLAYKRPNPGTQLGFDIGFEVRQMTCFNGLNEQNSLRTVTRIDSRYLDLILVGGELGGAICRPRAEDQDRDRPWEFMALGWISDLVTGKRTYDEFLPTRTQTSGNEWAASILNREHIIGWYKDWNVNRMVAGLRDRTPNELLLGNVLHALQGVPREQWPAGFNECKMAWAIQARNVFAYALYDFVGSERPSGLAVAYLQVYRNVSNTMTKVYNEGNDKAKVQSMVDVCMKLDGALSQTTYKSFIPVMSALINHGSDSDIFSFTTASALPLQIMKFGTFSIGEFINNPAPMSQEGKYVKGSQSSGLATKIRAATERTRQQVPDIGMAGLSTISTVMANFMAYANPHRLVQYGPDEYIGALQNQFAALRRLPNLANFAAPVRAAMAAFTDLRAPAVPTARVAGAATGFLQWAEASAAVAGTVH